MILILAPEPINEHSSDHEILAENLREKNEFIPIAYDALVFFSNSMNPIGNMSLKSLAEVYTGDIVNWQELGGCDSEIQAFQRPWYSYSQKIVNHILLNGYPLLTPETIKIYIDDGGADDDSMFSVVKPYNNDISALGYSMYYYMRDVYGLHNRIKLLSVNSIFPNPNTIINGEYPVRIVYYAIYPKSTPKTHPIRTLVSWLVSAEGQSVISSVGLLPLNLEPNLKNNHTEIYPKYQTSESSGTGGIKNRTADPLLYNKLMLKKQI